MLAEHAGVTAGAGVASIRESHSTDRIVPFDIPQRHAQSIEFHESEKSPQSKICIPWYVFAAGGLVQLLWIPVLLHGSPAGSQLVVSANGGSAGSFAG